MDSCYSFEYYRKKSYSRTSHKPYSRILHKIDNTEILTASSDSSAKVPKHRITEDDYDAIFDIQPIQSEIIDYQ
jgi:hypothetical protein